MFKLSSSWGAHLFNCIWGSAGWHVAGLVHGKEVCTMQCRPAEVPQVSGHSAVAVAGAHLSWARSSCLCSPLQSLPVQFK